MSRQTLLFLLFSLLMVGLAALNIFSGSVSLPSSEILNALLGQTDNQTVHFIVVESRLPATITALLSAAALALSGLMLQTIFQNPLADPSILGVNSGASLGVAAVMLLLGGSVVALGTELSGFLLIVAAAFVGALIIIGLLLMLAHFVRNNLTLLIVGIMISYVVSSMISLMNYLSTEQGVHSYVMWGLGNFEGVGLRAMPFFASSLLLVIGLGLTLIKPLNALLLGTEYAQNLGVNLRRTRTLLLITTGLASAIVTAFCGPVSFIGLAVPHLGKMIVKTTNHRVLMPMTLLIGANLGLLCNWLCSLPQDGTLIPLNVVTPLFGVPVILYVLLARK